MVFVWYDGCGFLSSALAGSGVSCQFFGFYFMRSDHGRPALA